MEQRLQSGKQLGHYQLVRLLGQGGFAEVYLGKHVHLQTMVAVKVLHTRLAHEAIEEFRREAQLVARLIHPHIIRVLDFGVEDGIPYLAMDLAPNGTLRQLYPHGRVVPLEQVRIFTRQVADALQYAHQQRLIHRDVKPENMLLGHNHQVLLSDFGIALVLESSKLQGADSIAGTVAYMAPEQIQGRPTPASDQYALAVVVYEWLSGKRPFQGSYTEIAVQQSMAMPPSLRALVPDISPAIEDVIMTALQKEPQRRYADVSSFALALDQAASQTVSQRFLPTFIKPHSGVPDNATVHVPPPSSASTLSTIQAPSSGSYPVQPGQPQFYTPRPASLASMTPGPVVVPPGHIAQQGNVPFDPSAYAYQGRQQRISRRGFLIGGVVGGLSGLAVAGGLAMWSTLNHASTTTTSTNPGMSVTGTTRSTTSAVGSGLDTPVLTYSGHTALVWKARWSPDGQYIATGSFDGTVRIWTADKGETRLSLRSTVQPPQSDDYPWSLCWAGKQQLLAVGFVDGTVQVLDMHTFSRVATLSSNDIHLALISWSPDARSMVVGSSGNDIRVYRYPDWSVASTYSEHTDTIQCLAWSPDGRYVASGAEDTHVRVWEPLTGKTHLVYTGHSDTIGAVCWSPDSKNVASLGRDQTVKIWNIDAGHTYATYTGGGGSMTEMSWSHDGRLIAIYNGSGQVDVVQAQNAQLQHRIASGVVYSLSWSPDDSLLVTGDYDNVAKIWRMR